MTQPQKLLDYLEQHPEGISLQDIRNNLYIMNPMEAARQLRLVHKIKVETFEIRRTNNNRPISGYRLPRNVSSIATAKEFVEGTAKVEQPQFGMKFCNEHKRNYPFNSRCPVCMTK